MILGTWAAVSLAFTSSSVYWVGVALFKVAARRMPPLRGDRPVRLVAEMLTEPFWLAGAGVVFVGLVMQGVALRTLSLPAAQPAFVASLAVLLVICLGFFAERLNRREWLSVTLIAAGTAMVAWAAAVTRYGPEHPPSPDLLALVIPPCVVGPVLVFLVCDRTPEGIHARPSTGVALGVTAGVLVGTAELALDCMVRLRHPSGSPLGTVYPYLFLVGAGLGVAQLQTALQRHRMVIIALVATVVAKTHLLLTGTVLYGLAWPRGGALLLLVSGVAAVGLAVAVLPRHERFPTSAEAGHRVRQRRRSASAGRPQSSA